MKVILLDNIASLGRKGDMKHVSDGYAINYLMPQAKAVVATTQNVAKHIAKVKNDDLALKEQINFYNKIKNTLNNTTVVFSAKVSEKDVLYQGISVATIIDAVKEKYGIILNATWFDNKGVLKKVAKHKLILNLPSSEKVVLYINIKSL